MNPVPAEAEKNSSIAMESNMNLVRTELSGLKLFRRGKVRDVYDLDPYLLIVTTDRISAYDVIMPNPVPDKGKILTGISAFWFDMTKSIAENHYLSVNVEDYPEVCKSHRDLLNGRSMLVEKSNPLPVECIVRGYLSGSGWLEYQKSGGICGIQLPGGLTESCRLEVPIFTPSTKAETGHDQNISFDEMGRIIGRELSEQIRKTSIAVYQFASEYALKKGIIIADTKMEFGMLNNRLMLIDELLTPDSSRFWPADQYRPGQGQPSFDKQYLRDYLNSIRWNKITPAPDLPDEIIRKTAEKYQQAFNFLTS